MSGVFIVNGNKDFLSEFGEESDSCDVVLIDSLR